MRKSTYIWTIFVLFSILIISLLVGNVHFNLSDTNYYLLTDQYIIKNAGNSNASNIKTNIFVGKNKFVDYGEELEIKYKPEPYSVTQDEFGNEIAQYQFNNLSAYQSINLEITRKFKSTDIVFDNIDSSNTRDIKGVSQYLQSSEKIEADNIKIINKAGLLTKNFPNDLDKAKAVFEFVNTYMNYDESDQYANKGALSALNMGKGVCEDYAALFTALCRAVGVPARVIQGYKFDSGINKNKGLIDASSNGHAWAEFFLTGYGWIPVETAQEYLENGIRVVNWNGFAKLKSSQYIATGIYNPGIHDSDIGCFIDEGHENEVSISHSKELIKNISSEDQK